MQTLLLKSMDSEPAMREGKQNGFGLPAAALGLWLAGLHSANVICGKAPSLPRPFPLRMILL